MNCYWKSKPKLTGENMTTKQQQDTQTMSLQGLVTELQDVVQLALDSEHKEIAEGIDFAFIMKQLLNIRNAVQVIHESYAKMLADAGLKEEDMNRMRADQSSWKPDHKKLLSSLQKLEKQCTTARDRIYKSLQENRATLKQVERELKAQGQKLITEKPVRSTKAKKAAGRSRWMKT
jgi:hypothetical protein